VSLVFGEVLHKEYVTPGMVRIVFGGEELTAFETTGTGASTSRSRLQASSFYRRKIRTHRAVGGTRRARNHPRASRTPCDGSIPKPAE
jgi:NADPH-dependent ferric siderophore reductase